MGRQPRIHFAGAVYHAIVRGNNRQPIFVQPEDQSRFGELVEEGVERFGHRIHAFCWMTNHVHLAVEVGETPLSHVLHNLCSRYANWFNRKHSRTGHLLERRYRAGLVQADISERRLIRYIHLNPVRAGVVRDPATFPWSSHRSYLGRETIPWLETRRILRLFGDSDHESRTALEDFVLFGLAEETEAEQTKDLSELLEDCKSQEDPIIKPSRNDSLPGGPPLWRLATLPEVLWAVSLAEGVEISELVGRSQKRELTRARAMAAYLGRQCQDLTIAGVARAIERDPSTVSRAAEGIAGRLVDDEDLSRRVRAIRANLRKAVLDRP